jgi:hypothetical protein
LPSFYVKQKLNAVEKWLQKSWAASEGYGKSPLSIHQFQKISKQSLTMVSSTKISFKK